MRPPALAACVLLVASCVACGSVGAFVDNVSKKECRKKQKLGGSTRYKAIIECQTIRKGEWEVFAW